MTTTTAPPEATTDDPHSSQRLICSMSGFRKGARASVSIALGALVWGVAFGVVAADTGFSGLASLAMSVLVYSGSAQMIAMDMVQRDAGMLAILVSTLLVSLRYILMGATMTGWFRTTSPWITWPGMHYLSDQSWAMSINELRHGHRDVGYFFGLNAGMVVAWVSGTAIGLALGDGIGGWSGLYFASTAALVGVLAGMEVHRKDILPWVVAGTTAITASRLVDGAWYTLIGIAAGMAVAIMTDMTMPGSEQWFLVLSMAVVLYLARIAGLVVADRLPDTARVRRMLAILPGITMVAIVLPQVAASGMSGIIASLAVWLIILRTGNLGLAILLGVGLVACFG